MDLAGRNTIRRGGHQTYLVTYGNSGNVDALGVILWVAGLPRNTTVTIDSGFRVLLPPRMCRRYRTSTCPFAIDNRERAGPAIVHPQDSERQYEGDCDRNHNGRRQHLMHSSLL